MKRFERKVFKLAIGARFVLILFFATAFAAGLCHAQSDNAPPQVGEGSLLYRSPISGRYEFMPLVHTDATVDVRGLVAAATVTQQYTNSTATPIEAVYVFPLPHDAAVYDMEIRIGERVIRSEIHEREEAKQIYEKARTDGKHAALLEQERPNIFTASVANIMPNDKVDVRLRYVEPLKWEAGKMRIVFPMVVGPRYIRGTQALSHQGTGWAYDSDAVPDASRITPVVRNPDTRPGHDVSITVNLDAGIKATTITSVSHDIGVQPAAQGSQRVTLIGGPTLPNKDFILELQQAESTAPATALFLSPEAGSTETNFLLTAFPPTVQPSLRLPVEMFYMIDVSGSMEGTSIQQARNALLQALDRLTPNDRFGILAFSSDYREFAQVPLPATPENLKAARDYVQGLRAGGGTEMLPALMHLMQKPATSGYLRHIILLTDGDLGNEGQIFTALRQSLGNARLYTVAIGSAPNLFLATKMAQFGRGTFTQISHIDEIQSQMSHLLESIESPVLTDVRLTFEGVQVSDVYPERLPDLFQRQPLVVYGRITKGQVGKMHLKARAGSEPYETTIDFDASAATFHPGITTLWARQRVEELMDRWQEATPDDRAEIRNAVIAHAIRYRLVTRFTSLVAVEQVVVNPGGQSNPVAVPSELPEGWQMDKVFGAPATGTTDSFFEVLGIAMLCAGLLMLVILRRQGGLS